MSNNVHLHYSDQLISAKQFIEQHDDFLVVSHIHPDGDAASSTFAVGLMLHHLHKRFTLINEDAIPSKFHYMQGSEQIVDYSSHGAGRSYEHVITVDCADFSRVGAVRELFSDSVSILNIDHHSTNDYFGNLQLIKADAAATAEVLFDLVETMRIPWTFELATCIYTGLITDTGGFRYSNTSPKVMEIAAKLLQYGVHGYQLAEELLEKITFSHIQLLKKALSSLSFSSDRRIGWICVSARDMEQTGASNEDFEGLVNYPRNIEGIEVGMLFKEVEAGIVKVSFRSSGKVDVSLVAKEFGGGGHIRAAGCTMAGSLESVTNQVVDKIGKVLA